VPATVLQAAVAGCTAALGLIAGGLWHASESPTSQLFGRTLVAGNDPNEFGLTFDDGPNPIATSQLLEVLARHQVKATFFAIGKYVRQHPTLARQILAEGHILGNHTMSHPRLSLEPEASIREELTTCNAVLSDITGAPIRYFRPPFGARRPIVLRIARELGLVPVLWNVTAYDWDPVGPHRIYSNLQQGIARNQKSRRGSNLLLHDGGHRAMGSPRNDTVLAVDRLLNERRAPPPRYVTVDAWSRYA